MNCELRKRSGQKPWARKANSAPAIHKFTIHHSLFIIALLTASLTPEAWHLKPVYARGGLVLCLEMYRAGVATFLFLGGSGST
jgi:hypothetical protein